MKLTDPCKRDFYPAVHTSGKRRIKDIKWFVVHDEESLTARSAASWFKNPDSGGSAHLAVDDNECYRCLSNETIPWGAHGANTNGFHIEQAGFAKWSLVIWKKHIRTIQRCATKIAQHKKLFASMGNDIPLVFVDAAGLKAGRKGITTHREVSKAFGGTHTDPGPFYPTKVLVWFCNYYFKRLPL